jgi:hypothetical protein
MVWISPDVFLPFRQDTGLQSSHKPNRNDELTVIAVEAKGSNTNHGRLRNF